MPATEQAAGHAHLVNEQRVQRGNGSFDDVFNVTEMLYWTAFDQYLKLPATFDFEQRPKAPLNHPVLVWLNVFFPIRQPDESRLIFFLVPPQTVEKI